MEMLGWFSVNIQGAQLLQCGDSNEFCPREIKENRSSKTEGISGKKKVFMGVGRFRKVCCGKCARAFLFRPLSL